MSMTLTSSLIHTPSRQQNILDLDAVEAHSCVDPLMPNSFLSKITTDNDKLTVVFLLKKEFGISGQERTQLTKTSGSKRPAVNLSLTVVFLLKKEFGILDLVLTGRVDCVDKVEVAAGLPGSDQDSRTAE